MTGARDQVNRLLALVPYLQHRGEISVAEAARDFGVTPRVIRRDINVLLFCGLPGLGMGDLIDVDFDALEGEDVIRLSNADYLTRPLRLDTTEAAALVAGLRALLDDASAEEREVLQRALTKIEAAAGEAAGVAASLDLRLAEDKDVLALRRELGVALTERRQVRLRHRSEVRDEVTERVVDPVALATAEGHGYLDAWCHLVQDRRLFRLDRIEAAELLETRVPADRALEPLDLTQGVYRPAPEHLTATLHLEPRARWVTEYYPVDTVAPQADGSCVVTLRVADRAWLVALLLRLGGTARVLEPAALAEEVRALAGAAVALYERSTDA